MKKIYLLIGMLLAVITTLSAQDITVQTLTYDSLTRDIMVDFPSDDGEQYEKVLMYYNMRCYDGQISTVGDRNRGCGEWDYSCNTYITDSSRIDSLIASHPNLIIGGFDRSTFPYYNGDRYDYYRSEMQRVNVSSSANLVSFDVGGGQEVVGLTSHLDAKRIKSQYLYTVEELQAAGMSAGPLAGLSFDISDGAGYLGLCRISLAHVEDMTELTGQTLGSDLQQVYFDHLTLSSDHQAVTFYEDFIWNGTDPILVEVSSEDADIAGMQLIGVADSDMSSLHATADANTILRTDDGDATLRVDDFELTGDEITVSFWFKGSDPLPQETSIIYGYDDEDNRQLNIHMPWINGEVYFDCGHEDGGFDRLQRGVNIEETIKEWNHWAFVKNASNGIMRILLNGETWESGFGNRNAINITRLEILNGIEGTVPIWGQVDGMRVFDKALSNDEVRGTMHRTIPSNHALYDRLVVDYDFNQVAAGEVTDQSSRGIDPAIEGGLRTTYQLARQLTNEASIGGPRPNLSFVRGNINRSVSTVIAMDSLPSTLFYARTFEIIDDEPTVVQAAFVHESDGSVIYDDDDRVYDFTDLPVDGEYVFEDLVYFQKRPMKYEIMSFVTPYGIDIDFGLDGKTWVFDVTKFAPILRGRKRMTLERGGEFQEEMDIRFEFHHGTPVRDIKSIAQIWPVNQTRYQIIEAEGQYEPRMLSLDGQGSHYEIHGVVTGHGQQGEFISRNHYLDLNDDRLYQWQAWEECAENPIYPQGGTWIFDRAGWCPGEPSAMEIVPIPDDVGDRAEVNYGVLGATGDSRYIVNMQLVEWGEPNFQTDAAIADIIAPSAAEEYGRFNPMCGHPTIIIQNTGANTLTSLRITYKVGDLPEESLDWSGELDFLETEEVEMPQLPLTELTAEGAYTVRVELPNGGVDEYGDNNVMTTVVRPVNIHNDEISIGLRTNARPNETSWRIFDADGNVVASRASSGLAANTLYTDVITDLNGCYELRVEDSDQDGLSFFANNDGNGSISLRDDDNGSTFFNPDFGAYISYHFIARRPSSTDESALEPQGINVYPNPGHDVLHIVSADGPIGDLQIYAMDGRPYHIGSVDEQQVRIPVEDWPTGSYVIRTADTIQKWMKL